MVPSFCYKTKETNLDAAALYVVVLVHLAAVVQNNVTKCCKSGMEHLCGDAYGKG